MNRSHTMHPRMDFARRPVPLAAPANQLTFPGGPRLGRRPFERAVRCAPVLPQISGDDLRRPTVPGIFATVAHAGQTTFLTTPSRIRGCVALICNLGSGCRGLRPLVPPVLANAANQRSFTDPLGSARPFVESSLVPLARLRVQRIGGVISRDFPPGVLGHRFRDSSNDLARHSELSDLRGRFPGSNDRQDSTFSRKKCRRAAGAYVPAAPARVRHASEGITIFPKIGNLTA